MNFYEQSTLVKIGHNLAVDIKAVRNSWSIRIRLEENEAGKEREGETRRMSARYFSGNYALSAEAALPVRLYISRPQ